MIEIERNKKEFYECFNVVASLVPEVNITFDVDEIFVRAVHPSNHCIITLKLNSKMFERYEVGKQTTYILECVLFMKILKTITKNKFEINSTEDVLIFKDKKNEFSLNYFVGNNDDRPLPSFNHTSIINIDSTILFDCVNKAIVFDQIGNFEVKENKFFINSKSHMIKGKMELDTNNIQGSESKLFFDFTYINLIENIKNIFDNVDVYLADEIPLVIKSKNENIDFMFMLANRVKDE